MRGIVTFAKAALVPVRITPACAGNSAVIEVVELDSEDHPRMCGD